MRISAICRDNYNWARIFAGRVPRKPGIPNLSASRLG
jgi:hypothetical protein